MRKEISISLALMVFCIAAGMAAYTVFSLANQAILGRIKAPKTTTAQCDKTLWDHVYAGRFGKAQDRLKVITDCTTVTGTIVNAVAEKDGDWHVRLQLDSQFTSMLNAKNISGQKGYLVLEPVCANAVSQKDTIAEGVCDNFIQTVFKKSYLGKHVQVTGAYVTDMEHGWNEIHPVSSIVVQ